MSEDNLPTVDCSDVITAEEPIIHLTENGVEGYEILCRLCANRSDHLIPIFSEEGITNDLADKINLYLPVKITKTDLLPLQCCFQCASTVLTWHELVVASVEADRRLREVQSEVEKQIAEQDAEPGPSQIEEDPIAIDRVIDSSSASLNPFRQEIQPEFKSEEPVEVDPLATPRKRSRAKRHHQDIKFESAPDLTTDGEWIKTELVLEPDDVNPFIADCELTEEQDMKLSPGGEGLSGSESDFDELDPEYDPRNESKSKQHYCTSCGKIFNKLIDLKKHSKICPEDPNKNPQKKREYRCDYCHSTAARKEDLRKHVQTEHPEHYESFTDKRKTRRRSKIDQDAVNRAKVVVDKRTYYHCNECGKNLHSPYTYIWHNRIHTGERPFVCDLCGKQFRVSQGLVRHLRETHAGIKNFPCDLCGRMFATRRNVEEHRRIHTNERPYICDLCGKAFKQKASLFVHNRSHTDSFPFKCSYCNQGFRTRPPLLVHVTRHTGEKPYACDICGRCFRIKYELKRHRLIHSDDKPFSCTDCGLSFRQKRYLRNHNKINHDRLTP